MIHSVNSGNVNSQIMIRQSSQSKQSGLKAAGTAEKKQRTLEEEKQAIQNSLLIMKTTSSDSAGSEESIELLEKKLEEIQNEIKSGNNVLEGVLSEKESSLQPEGVRIRNNFDIYVKGK